MALLAGCGSLTPEEKAVKNQLAELTIELAEGDDANSITRGFSVPLRVGENEIEWKSSNEDVVKVQNGKVVITYPDKDIKITLTASVQVENKTISHTFKFTIKAARMNEVKFFVDGVQVGETQQVRSGDNAILPDTPTKAGYRFDRWDKDHRNVGADLSINAVFVVEEYQIFFDTKGGSHIEPIKLNYNGTVVRPQDPTKDGYKFLGWEPELPLTMPANNLTVYAKWEALEPKVHTFSFEVTSPFGTPEEFYVVDTFNDWGRGEGEAGTFDQAVLDEWKLVLNEGKYVLTNKEISTSIGEKLQYKYLFKPDNNYYEQGDNREYIITGELPNEITINDTISQLPVVEIEYTFTFEVVAPTGTSDTINITGPFGDDDNWQTAGRHKLVKNEEGKWVGNLKLTLNSGTKLEYKLYYIDSDEKVVWEELPDNSNRDYVVGYDNEISITIESVKWQGVEVNLMEYTLTFNVNAPEGTPDTINVAGAFGEGHHLVFDGTHKLVKNSEGIWTGNVLINVEKESNLEYKLYYLVEGEPEVVYEVLPEGGNRTEALGVEAAVTINITSVVWPEPVEPEGPYKLSLSVNAPYGTPSEFYVVGTFNNWGRVPDNNEAGTFDQIVLDEWKLSLVDGSYVLNNKELVEVLGDTLEYKYLGRADSRYFETYTGNRSYVITEDTLTNFTIADTITNWEKVEANYTITFEVEFADLDTPDTIYVAGTFGETEWSTEEPRVALAKNTTTGKWEGAVATTKQNGDVFEYKFYFVETNGQIAWENSVNHKYVLSYDEEFTITHDNLSWEIEPTYKLEISEELTHNVVDLTAVPFNHELKVGTKREGFTLLTFTVNGEDKKALLDSNGESNVLVKSNLNIVATYEQLPPQMTGNLYH